MMSRRTIGWIIISYYLAAFGFALFQAFELPFTKLNAGTISEAMGVGFAILAMSGIIPLLIWTRSRYSSEKAERPLVIWLVLGILAAFFSEIGFRSDRDTQIAELTNKAAFDGKDRDDFARMYQMSCEKNQRSNKLTSQIGLTDKAINAYCNCMAERMAKEITVDEVKYAATTGKQPESVQDKALRIAPGCSNMAIAK